MSQENHEERIAALESKVKMMEGLHSEQARGFSTLVQVTVEAAAAQQKNSEKVTEISKFLGTYLPDEARKAFEKIVAKMESQDEFAQHRVAQIKAMMPPDDDGNTPPGA